MFLSKSFKWNLCKYTIQLAWSNWCLS